MPLKDPADILKEFGADHLIKLVNCAIIGFDFLMSLGKRRFNLADSRSLAQAVAVLFPFLDTADGDVARSKCVHDIADEFGVDEKNVWTDYAAWGQSGRTGRMQTDAEHEKEPVRMTQDLYLLTAVFVAVSSSANPANAGSASVGTTSAGTAARSLPDLLAKLKECAEDFEDPHARDLYISLEEARRRDITDFNELLALIKSEELQSFVREKAARKEFSVHTEQIIDDSIKRLRMRKLERKRSALVNRMRLAKNKDANAGASAKGNNITGDSIIGEMLLEKVAIDSELRRLKGVDG
jgi:DNA primase